MMMIKLSGLSLCFMFCVIVGSELERKQRQRFKAVESIEYMIDEITVMLKYNSMTLAELIKHLGNNERYKSFKLIPNDFSRWDINESLMQNCDNLKYLITLEQKEHLQNIFSSLGKTDLEGQLCFLSAEKAFFTQEKLRLKEELTGKCKMYNSLGVLSGAMLIVMLM